MTNVIHVTRAVSELRAGDLVQVSPAVMGFVCWVELPDGENSFSAGIGYLGADGEYHERTAEPAYTVYLEHPVIGEKRALEATALSWAEA